MITVTDAQALENYQLKITFNTGEQAVTDITSLTEEGVFQKLKDPRVFKDFVVDDTVIWDNGFLDIAPEYLYFQAFKNEKLKNGLFKKWGYIS